MIMKSENFTPEINKQLFSAETFNLPSVDTRSQLMLEAGN